MSIDTQRVQLLMMGMLLSPADGVLLRHILRCSASAFKDLIKISHAHSTPEQQATGASYLICSLL